MISSCPSCSSRSLFASANGLMRCGSCGHSWLESRSAEVIDVPHYPLPARRGPVVEQDAEVTRLLETAREARDAFKAARREKLNALRKWAALAAGVALPFAAAAAFSEAVIALAPATAPVYQRLGIDVNIYGLEIRNLEQKHILDGAVRVLAVKGEIVNVSGRDRKVPALRLALDNELGEEAYVWTVDNAVRPLRPGEATVFTTRVQDPPVAAKKLEIRFARKDELRSNAAP